jgi:glutamate 5-kinase
MPNQPLHNAKRLVIKISSSLLVAGARAEINQSWLADFITDIVACGARGQEIILVTSGAVALGRRILQLPPTGALRLEESQAAAACGQIKLIHAYQEALAKHQRPVAQLLLTPHDTEARQPYLNARATLRNLLALGVIPVINENDAVTTPALRFTDNDQLAARVAAMIEAECLILLSDIDGLYTADPRLDPAARFIPEVRGITPEISAMAGESRSGTGRGGMKTKLAAARIAMQAGCAMAIARGTIAHPLQSLFAGGACTWFIPEHTPLAAWKIWISGSLNPRGSLTLDAGAVHALQQGKSLLAAGVTGVVGNFEQGDPVQVLAADGQEIARGLIAYNAAETRRIMGHKSETFAALLGYTGHDELIHRDDLAVL